MLQLNGYLHRERLSELLGRCLISAFEGPEGVRADSCALKQIVNFNAYCGCLILDAFGCLSPLSSIDEIPIRLWDRYMPDYIDQLHSRLAGTSAEADFTQACTCGEIDAKDPRSISFEPWASPGGR